MQRVVKKNGKWFFPLSWGLTFFRKEIVRYVKFDNNYRYITEKGSNQSDWNKLFGITEITFKGHQWNSWRFVARYNPDTDKVEIGSYIYEQGILRKMHLYSVAVKIFDTPWLRLSISQEGEFVVFRVNYQVFDMKRGKLPIIGWRLGSYFGGDERTRKKLTFWMTWVRPKNF